MHSVIYCNIVESIQPLVRVDVVTSSGPRDVGGLTAATPNATSSAWSGYMIQGPDNNFLNQSYKACFAHGMPTCAVYICVCVGMWCGMVCAWYGVLWWVGWGCGIEMSAVGWSGWGHGGCDTWYGMVQYT